MGYLERFARKKENRTETVTARLDPGTHRKFKELCNKLGLTVSEAVALLVEKEVRGSADPTIRATQNEHEDIHYDDKDTHDEHGGIQRYTPPPRPKQKPPRPQRPGTGGRFTTQPFVVDGRLPCPICGTWPERQANIARHMRDIHESTTKEVYTAHMETVKKMVATARGEI